MFEIKTVIETTEGGIGRRNGNWYIWAAGKKAVWTTGENARNVLNVLEAGLGSGRSSLVFVDDALVRELRASL